MPFIKQLSIFAKKTAAVVISCTNALYAGQQYSAFISGSSGRAWGWGNNNVGQLGNNTILSQRTPVSVLGTTKTFCNIAGGLSHTVGLDKNGRAWGWGLNSSGQLGNNAIISQLTPVSVLGTTKTFCQIAGNPSANYTVALDKNGRAWGWGINNAGQLGNNTIISQLTPVSVLGTTNTFYNITGGNAHTVALDLYGRAWAWGANGQGQLGNNAIISQLTPVSVLGTTKTFCKIAGGANHTIALDKNGRAWAWGYNNVGQLGNNAIISQRTPVSVLGTTKTFCQISGGDAHTLAVDKNGKAWGWGNNANGQLGNNSTTSTRTPVSVLGTTKTFCQIAGGLSHTIAVDKNGRAWAWGGNTAGQLGDNSLISRITPVSVVGTTKTFCKIAGGDNHTIALDKNGKVWAWGLNSSFQLGNNSSIARTTPVSVLGTTKTFCQIAGGSSHTIALDKNGRAWAWGINTYGQLGDNSVFTRATPTSVLGTTKTFCQIAGGFYHTVGLDKNGRAWGWGYNADGELGNNTIISQLTPVSVLGTTKTFCQIASGWQQTIALDLYGRAWAWGINTYGQLGNNAIISQRTPVSVLGTTKTFCQIAGTNCHTIALDKNGKVWAWGGNGNGQLGNNAIISQRTPVSVLGTTKTFCQIAGGNAHTIALDKNGRVWAWGLNGAGQLGNNTILSQRTPVSVLGTTKTFCQIAAGYSYTLAVDKNGRSWGWGLNTSGQLGDNSGDKLTPVRVCNL